jgi:flagellar basal body-associated protein FliL
LEGKSIYTILLSIIAVLSLALAVIIIFLFISFNPNQQTSGKAQLDNSISERVVPDDEMIEFKLFNGEERIFALKDDGENQNPLVMVSVSLKCDAGARRRKEKEITNLVSVLYQTELEQAVGDYFADMSLAEAKELETRYKARDDLIEIFNEILNENKPNKQKIVYRVTLQMLPQ